MGHSDRMFLLAGLVPFGALRDALFGRHFERCPECSRRLATREEARRLLVGETDLGDLGRIWPAVCAAISSPGPAAPFAAARVRIPAWKWLAAGAGLALAVVLTWTAVRTLQPGAGLAGSEIASAAAPAPELAASAADVELGYVRIENEPARTIIFKPYDANLVLIWAGRN